ncbi:MAG TPA: hypothetical protein VJ798_13400 [Rhizomicrobium sp.]|nr:hypothetical protein [Rhizomicrobium sp.]
MKPTLKFLLVLALCGCTPSVTGNAGNPGDRPYAGETGSVYDMAANPPAVMGSTEPSAAQIVPLTDIATLPPRPAR